MIRAHITDREALEALKPERVRSYLEAKGWRSIGGAKSFDLYRHERNGDRFEALLPIDPDCRDFARRMSELLRVVALVEDRSELEIIMGMGGNIGTAFRTNDPEWREAHATGWFSAPKERYLPYHIRHTGPLDSVLTAMIEHLASATAEAGAGDSVKVHVKVWRPYEPDEDEPDE
jgi:hypothetical protein